MMRAKVYTGDLSKPLENECPDFRHIDGGGEAGD